jgi:K+-transporting ATPase ATPase A chain
VLGFFQIAVVVVVLAAAYVPLGDYMARVFGSAHDTRVESLLYRVARVNSSSEQTWVGYSTSLLGFSFAGVVFLFVLQRIQGVLPLNGGLSGVSPAMAFNTAASFVTNTNWQSYVPETTMSNLTQPLGLAVQNFVSAAVGLAVAIAVVRGFVRVSTGGELGNFWVDLTRGTLRILLPLSVLVAVIMLTQGTVMSFSTGFTSTGLDGQTVTNALAPVASQEAIKEIGTNGGGILAANSAHPFENPTPLTNIVQIISLLLIPVALTRTFGTMIGNRKQGLTLLAVMATLWATLLAVTLFAESGTRGVAATAAGAICAVRGVDDRNIDRRSQFGPRQYVCAGRRSGVAEHAVRRDRAGWRRHRSVRIAGARGHRRLRRWSARRPNSGIPR